MFIDHRQTWGLLSWGMYSNLRDKRYPDNNNKKMSSIKKGKKKKNKQTNERRKKKENGKTKVNKNDKGKHLVHTYTHRPILTVLVARSI